MLKWNMAQQKVRKRWLQSVQRQSFGPRFYSYKTSFLKNLNPFIKLIFVNYKLIKIFKISK